MTMKKTILASAIAVIMFSPTSANAITADEFNTMLLSDGSFQDVQNTLQDTGNFAVQNASDIIDLQNAKANQTDLDKTNQQVATNTSAISNLTTTVDSKANQADLSVTNQRVATNTSAIGNLNNVVVTKADQSYVDNQNQAQDTVIASKANQTDLDATNQKVTNNSNQINTVNTKLMRLDAIKADKGTVDNLSTNVANLKTENANIQTTLQLHDKGIVILNTDMRNLTNVVDTKANQIDLDNTSKQVLNNTNLIQSIGAETQRLENVKADKVAVSNLDNKINTEVRRLESQNLGQNMLLENHTNQINSLGYRINKMDKNLSAGIAGSTALAMMPTLNGEGSMITGGTGLYNGESAFALGISGTTGNVSYKVGASWVSSGDATYGAGFGLKF